MRGLGLVRNTERKTGRSVTDRKSSSSIALPRRTVPLGPDVDRSGPGSLPLEGCGKGVSPARHSPSDWKPQSIPRQLRHEWNSCPSPNWRDSEIFRKLPVKFATLFCTVLKSVPTQRISTFLNPLEWKSRLRTKERVQ